MAEEKKQAAQDELMEEAAEHREEMDEREPTGEETLPEAPAEETDCEDAGDQEAEEEQEDPDAGDDSQDESESGGDAAEGESEGRRLFGKKKKDKKDEQIEELNDRLKRQMAEFENFRKRTEKEKTQMFAMGARNVIEKILPVVDNFERGLAAVPEEEKGSGFAEGMDKIYRQLMTELEAIGVTPIEAVGKEFDPEYHNAVMQVESEEYESGTVAQELQKGYMYQDSVVRHSMVAVVQ